MSPGEVDVEAEDAEGGDTGDDKDGTDVAPRAAPRTMVPEKLCLDGMPCTTQGDWGLIG